MLGFPHFFGGPCFEATTVKKGQKWPTKNRRQQAVLATNERPLRPPCWNGSGWAASCTFHAFLVPQLGDSTNGDFSRTLHMGVNHKKCDWNHPQLEVFPMRHPDPKWLQRYPPVTKDRFGRHMVPMNIIYIPAWFSKSPGIFTGGYTPTTWSRLVRQIPTPWSSLEGISPYHDRFSNKNIPLWMVYHENHYRPIYTQFQ